MFACYSLFWGGTACAFEERKSWSASGPDRDLGRGCPGLRAPKRLSIPAPGAGCAALCVGGGRRGWDKNGQNVKKKHQRRGPGEAGGRLSPHPLTTLWGQYVEVPEGQLLPVPRAPVGVPLRLERGVPAGGAWTYSGAAPASAVLPGTMPGLAPRVGGMAMPCLGTVC